jgi:hypothetical protein
MNLLLSYGIEIKYATMKHHCIYIDTLSLLICIEYTSKWVAIELQSLDVIGVNCIALVDINVLII